jgi:hypothetical protein
MKKPKCYGCGKSDKDIHYLWFKGNLWHYRCILKVTKIIYETKDEKQNRI